MEKEITYQMLRVLNMIFFFPGKNEHYVSKTLGLSPELALMYLNRLSDEHKLLLRRNGGSFVSNPAMHDIVIQLVQTQYLIQERLRDAGYTLS